MSPCAAKRAEMSAKSRPTQPGRRMSARPWTTCPASVSACANALCQPGLHLPRWRTGAGDRAETVHPGTDERQVRLDVPCPVRTSTAARQGADRNRQAAALVCPPFTHTAGSTWSACRLCAPPGPPRLPSCLLGWMQDLSDLRVHLTDQLIMTVINRLTLQ